MALDPNVSIPIHITSQTTLTPAIRLWSYFLEDQGRSIHTVKAFTADIDLLATYLPPDYILGNITTQDLNNYLHWLQSSRGIPCSPKSLARRVTSIKSFFRWLHEAGSIPVNPAEKVLQQSVISPLPEVLSITEVQKVLHVAEKYRHNRKPDARPYTLLALLLHTGIKKGECLSLYLNHFDLSDPNNPFLFVRYPNARNRYKERKITVPTNWIQSYNEYLEQYQPATQVFPWSPRRLEYILEDIGKDAGLNKHVSFDMCRWTSALIDWTTGMEKEKIRQKLGISKIQWREISMKLRQLAEKG